MNKEMDELLHHWADQHRGRGLRQCSPLGALVEFGGMPPRSCNPKGSRDPLGLGEMDDAAWRIEQALRTLHDRHQVLAHEHYRWGGYSDDKSARLGIAKRTYYDRLDRLHDELRAALQASFRRQRLA